MNIEDLEKFKEILEDNISADNYDNDLSRDIDRVIVEIEKGRVN